MGTAETKSLQSLIVGIGSMSSLTFCSKWILGHETHRSLYPEWKVASQCTSLSVLCVGSWVCTNICQLKFLSMTSSVRENVDVTMCQLKLPRVTTPMMESGGLARWTRTQSRSATCPSIVNLLKQMASEVGTEKSQLTPVQENQL